MKLNRRLECSNHVILRHHCVILFDTRRLTDIVWGLFWNIICSGRRTYSEMLSLNAREDAVSFYLKITDSSVPTTCWRWFVVPGKKKKQTRICVSRYEESRVDSPGKKERREDERKGTDTRDLINYEISFRTFTIDHMCFLLMYISLFSQHSGSRLSSSRVDLPDKLSRIGVRIYALILKIAGSGFLLTIPVCPDFASATHPIERAIRSTNEILFT